MRDLPFLVLVLVLYGALLSARWGLHRLPATVDEAVEPAAAEGVMALPPKPEGVGRQLGEGEGGAGTAAITEEACARMARAVQDVCWQALARQAGATDPDRALGECARIADPELSLECRADVAETLAPRDRDRAVAICGTIASTKWRGQCHFGIGLALAEIDAAYALGRCEDAEAFRDFCRHDVVGEVALVDLEAAVAFCAREEGDVLTRKTCWHGIGKYLARRDLGEAAAACRRSTPAWQGNCFHGAGWGAAERDPDAALAGCDRQAPYVDNCRQGVAHQLKRADPARAVALCESIGTPAIRARCLAFVRR